MITNGTKQLNDKSSTSWLARRGLLTIAVVTIVALLLAVGGEPVRTALQYDRASIRNGELWRLITGHLVHGSWRHTIVNVLGVVLMAALFNRTYSIRSWLMIILVGATCIDLGFWFLMPQLQWYVGLSGVLHTVLAAGTITWWKTESKFLAGLLTLIMIGKLIWEQTQGALPLSGELPVVVNAHLYGEIGGLIGAALCWREVSNLKPRSPLSTTDHSWL
jgi:rhomboid family GlyGly-CTERM serine protease